MKCQNVEWNTTHKHGDIVLSCEKYSVEYSVMANKFYFHNKGDGSSSAVGDEVDFEYVFKKVSK